MTQRIERGQLTSRDSVSGKSDVGSPAALREGSPGASVDDLTQPGERRRLEIILDTIPSGVVIIEAPDGRISYVNARAIELYGQDPRGIQMKDHVRRVRLLKLDGREYAPEALPASRALISGETVYREELIIGRPDGSRLIVRASAAPLRDEKGEITAAVGVFFDVTDQKEMEQALRRSRDELEELVALRTRQLTALSRRLVDVQEMERRMMARELHDEIGQSLTALKMFVDDHPYQTPGDVDPRILEASQTLNDLIWQIRNLSMRLRPTMLDDLGLLATLLWHFEGYTERTKIRVVFKHSGLRRRLPLEVTVVAYRVIQEALNNVARHASANEVLVCVRRESNTLYVEIEDRGVGFNVEEAGSTSAIGIIGMRERLLSLGGTFKLESSPGGGTYVMGEIPLESTNRLRSGGRRGVRSNRPRTDS